MKTRGVIFVILLALVPALLLPGGRASATAHASNSRTSKIVGVVLDAKDARIVDATVRIEKVDFSLVVQSSDEGKFEVELPAGEYRITVEKDGFHKFELSPFRARASVRELLNIRMKVKPPPSTLKI
jgi:Carboxypeptidase regulatory-like domain